jgi:hypothetical protein
MDPNNSGAAQEYSLAKKAEWLANTSGPMVVPMVVYLTMNMLSFVALQRIDAGLFTILAQVRASSEFAPILLIPCPSPSPALLPTPPHVPCLSVPFLSVSSSVRGAGSL